jgi:hypothetical protein
LGLPTAGAWVSSSTHGLQAGGASLTNTRMKTKDTRKETKKMPTKTAKEKKLAKQAKKNSK